MAEDSNQQLRVMLIGKVRVEWCGRSVLSGKRKALALLCYLATHPAHRASRTQLAGLLWADSDEQKSRNSLRQCLADIRREMPAANEIALDVESDMIGLRPLRFITDLDRVLSEVSKGHLADALEAQPSLPDALMGGLHGLSDAYDSWIRSVAQGFETAMLSRLREVLGNVATDRNLRLRVGRLITSIDPLNEEACRAAMRAFAELGETGASLRAYEQLYQLLDDELGMEPSAKTQALVVAIKTGALDAEPSPRTPAAPRSRVLVPRTGPPRIAVMPFADLGPDKAPAFFCEGILDDTVAQLVRLQELQVYSSNSTRKFRGLYNLDSNDDLDIDAEYFVLGTVRSSNFKYRITVQMVDAESGLTEWAQTYSVALSELFDMQSDIAANIAHQLAPAVSDAELRRIEGALPTDLDAYHLTLRARDISFAMNPDTFQAARASLIEAQGRDPDFALSSLVLADWYSIAICQGWSREKQADERALQRSASEAVRISRESGRALSMYAHNQTVLAGFVEEAAEICEKALISTPNDAETLLWSVPTLTFVGKEHRAIENAQKAIALSPHDPFMFRYKHFLSIAQFAMGDAYGAARSGQYSFQLNPLYTSNLRMTAASLVEIGELEEARKMARDCCQMDPGFRVSAFMRKQPFKKIETGERYAARLLECGMPN